MANIKQSILGLEEVLHKIEQHTGASNPIFQQQVKEIEERCQVLESIADSIQSAFFNQPQLPGE